METGRRIFKNMMSLSVAEIANKGIAFITFTYLARVLTPEGLGIFGWAQAFVIYFVFIVDLGFNVVGPREIARFPNKIRKYVNNITSIKVSFALILYFFLLIATYFLDKPVEVKYVLLISGLNIFANSILFNWVFQGIEKMGIIAIRQVTTSVLNLIGVLIFVNNHGDIILAMSIIIGSLLLNSLWMFFYYIKLYGWIKLEFDFKFWKKLLTSSIPIAVTIFITVLYNNFSIFLLGIMKSDYDTGIYVVAFRVLAFIIIPTGIIQYAFMTQLARSLTIEDKHKFTGKYVLLTFLIGTIITTGFFTFADYITIMGFRSAYKDSVIIVQLLMIAGLLAYINVSYSAPLLSWNHEKKIFWAMAAGGVVNITLNLLLIPKYGAVGAGITAIFTEFTVMIGLGIIIYKTIKKTYLFSFIIILSYAVISCLAGYYLMKTGLHPLAAGIIALFIFVLINFIFKTITISEIKETLKKN